MTILFCAPWHVFKYFEGTIMISLQFAMHLISAQQCVQLYLEKIAYAEVYFAELVYCATILILCLCFWGLP